MGEVTKLGQSVFFCHFGFGSVLFGIGILYYAGMNIGFVAMNIATIKTKVTTLCTKWMLGYSPLFYLYI